ncbi:hypothetical protein D3C72_529620 [compost metagenome]
MRQGRPDQAVGVAIVEAGGRYAEHGLEHRHAEGVEVARRGASAAHDLGGRVVGGVEGRAVRERVAERAQPRAVEQGRLVPAREQDVVGGHVEMQERRELVVKPVEHHQHGPEDLDGLIERQSLLLLEHLAQRAALDVLQHQVVAALVGHHAEHALHAGHLERSQRLQFLLELHLRLGRHAEIVAELFEHHHLLALLLLGEEGQQVVAAGREGALDGEALRDDAARGQRMWHTGAAQGAIEALRRHVSAAAGATKHRSGGILSSPCSLPVHTGQRTGLRHTVRIFTERP